MSGPGDDPDALLREAEHNRRLAPNAETDDPGNSDRFHARLLPGLRKGYPTRDAARSDEAARDDRPGPHNDDAALNSKGGADHSGRAPGEPPRQDAAGNPLVPGTRPVIEAKAARDEGAGDDRPPSGGPVIWGNAPRPSPAGSGSGANISHTVVAGTAGSMGQVGPGTSIQAAMGAVDQAGPGSGTASGTWTREDPARQRRADDIPIADPRPKGQRPKSDA